MSCAKETLLVSMCFLRGNCKWDGTDNIIPEVVAFLSEYNTIVVCPEMFGALGCPRRPSEIREVHGERRVFTDAGEDVTHAFYDGAYKALRLAAMAHVRYALLKAKSPSCGAGAIYDGSFSGKLVPGDGIFARLLKDHHIQVYNESQLDALRAAMSVMHREPGQNKTEKGESKK